MSKGKLEKVTTSQALAIATLLIDFELEYPQVDKPPPEWTRELRQARQVLTDLLQQALPCPKPDYLGQTNFNLNDNFQV